MRILASFLEMLIKIELSELANVFLGIRCWILIPQMSWNFKIEKMRLERFRGSKAREPFQPSVHGRSSTLLSSNDNKGRKGWQYDLCVVGDGASNHLGGGVKARRIIAFLVVLEL